MKHIELKTCFSIATVFAILSTTGCNQIYLRSLETRMLLPVTSVEPIISNNERIIISGQAMATSGESMHTISNANPDSTQRQNVSNVEMTPPILTGMMNVTYHTPRLFCVGLSGSLARTKGEYGSDLTLHLGLANAFEDFGWRGEFLAGLNLISGNAAVEYYRELSDYDAWSGRSRDTTFYDTIRNNGLNPDSPKGLV